MLGVRGWSRHLRGSGSGRGRGACLRGEREGHGPRESEGGACAVRDGEKRVRRGVMRETLTFIFILGHIYGPSLGLLGLGLFTEADLISGPPPKIEIFLETGHL